MPRKAHPDGGVLDVDRGSGPVGVKETEVLSMPQYLGRDAERRGLHGLDRMTEAMPGLTRQQKDRDRISPRATTAPLGHRQMDRPLPAQGARRTPLSGRQKKARSKTRNEVQRRQPRAQRVAQKALVTRPAVWSRINDQLSETTGDVQALSDADHQLVKRVDRSIQAYERANDRGHRIYTNVAMPKFINHTNLKQFTESNFDRGTEITFDRFTSGAHQIHEIETVDPAGRTAVFEIHTRRGAYLGQSDKADNTAHLLPRGMKFTVAGSHEATYTRPDGTTGRRQVIQLIDTTPTN